VGNTSFSAGGLQKQKGAVIAMFGSLSLTPSIVWLVLMVIFTIIEGITVGLVSLWFALGALAALLVSLFCGDFWVQTLVFAMVSLLALLLVMTSDSLRSTEKIPTNADRLIGKNGIVVEAIDNLTATGQVKVAGQLWTARSAADTPISAGVEVKILSIEGVKLFVEPVTTNQIDNLE
jgi:membrane protein implicated in regulation of membrane protease activity